MNTEDSEFERIEREQKMRGVPDAIHYTDTCETMEYIQGWNDCRQAMLAEQPAQQEPVAWHTEDHLTDRSATTYSKDVADRWKLKGWPVTPLYTTLQAQQRPCRSCDGTGERFTGIDEAPTTQCKPCNGTGQIALVEQG